MKALEGWGLIVSAEWLHSLSTGLVFLLAAGWLILWIGRAQRAALWADGVALLSDSGVVEPVWSGWCLRVGDTSVWCTAGLRGTRTRVVKSSGEVVELHTVPAPDALRQLI